MNQSKGIIRSRRSKGQWVLITNTLLSWGGARCRTRRGSAISYIDGHPPDCKTDGMSYTHSNKKSVCLDFLSARNLVRLNI